MAQIDWRKLTDEKKGDEEVRKILDSVSETEITDLSEPHVPCILLLDTSGSMNSENKINELNNALSDFKEQVCQDKLSAKRVDVCVIEFNSTVSVIVPFCPILKFNPPTLTAKGATNMADGIRYALEAAQKQIHRYHSLGVECYKPYIIMITDGYPTQEMDGIPELIAAREEQGRYGHLKFHAFGVKGADLDLLTRLTKRTAAVKDNAFGAIFNWVSKSMQIVSHSHCDENPIGPPTPVVIEPIVPDKPLPIWWS